MKRFFTIITFTLIGLFLNAQETIADFENFNLAPGEFLNGSDGTSSFESEFLILSNNYNEAYNSWTGWAISATTDTVTSGFENQFSAITGRGVDGSDAYAVSFNFEPNPVNFLSSNGGGSVISHVGVFITNSTYTYLSNLEGDDFAKKFGGVSGTDPDFNLLTISGINTEGQLDSVELYLADYRSDNSDEDYILDEWTYVDLSKFQYDSELTFGLTTSDVGVYGPNTPAFFCIDNFIFDVVTSTEDEIFSDLDVFPNPATDILNVELDMDAKYYIINNQGRLIISSNSTTTQIDISNLASGIYNLIIASDHGSTTRRFVKL